MEERKVGRKTNRGQKGGVRKSGKDRQKERRGLKKGKREKKHRQRVGEE